MILHINGRFYGQPTTGVQRYGRELVGALDALLAERGFPAPFSSVQLHVPATPRARVPSMKVVEIQTYGMTRGHVWEQLELPRRARAGMLFCPGNVAPVRALLRRIPVVVTIHDLSFRYFPREYRWQYRLWYHVITPLVMRRAARIITVSESERAAITQLYPLAANRTVAIQNGGTATSPPLTHPDSPVAAPYILYVGSLSERKNFSGVLAAFDHLTEKHPGLRLVVVGGRAAALTRRRLPSRVSDGRNRITLLGQMEDQAALDAMYRSASCLVFPSFYEASPLPPIEAMARGCPVVAADIPSLRERCGDAAHYCDPHDPRDIARVVSRVLDNPHVAETLRTAGLARAAQFSWLECADRTLRILAAAVR